MNCMGEFRVVLKMMDSSAFYDYTRLGEPIPAAQSDLLSSHH